MLKTNEITEDMVRKYARAEIVHDLDESIRSYTKWNLMTLEVMEPDYTEERVKEIEKNSHEQAMCWLKRKYYELFKDMPRAADIDAKLQEIDMNFFDTWTPDYYVP